MARTRSLLKELSDRLYHMFETNTALRNDLAKAGSPPVIYSHDEAIKLIAERGQSIANTLKAHDINE